MYREIDFLKIRSQKINLICEKMEEELKKIEASYKALKLCNTALKNEKLSIDDRMVKICKDL